MARNTKPQSSLDPIAVRAARTGGRYAIVAAVAGAVVATGTGVTFALLAGNRSGPAPTGTSASASFPHSASARPYGQLSASLTYPTNNTMVSRGQGFIARGTVKGLEAGAIWIFDHPAGVYYIDAEAEIDNGKWWALDRRLGSKSDPLPYRLAVVAIFATPECATTLRHLESVDDVRLYQMPSGCYQFGEVTVDVNRP